MFNIAIIIPIYNRLEITKQGLIALNEALNYNNLDSAQLNCEIIIVDDGCTDGSSDWIKQNYPKTHILQGDGNLWWTGSINMGAKYALDEMDADYILLWNDDLFLDKQYFLILSDFLNQNHPLNYVCGSRICYDKDNQMLWSAGGFFSKWTGNKYTIRDVNEKTGILDCHWQPGMGTLVPRFVLDEKNIWWDNIKYPHYYGDSNFTLKCTESGIPVKTNLELLIFNRTELTGDIENASFKFLWNSLFSIRSFYELKRNLMFYTEHGVFPFVYYGMIKKYIYYFGKVLKLSFKLLIK